MADAAAILARVRSFGANVVPDGDTLRIVNGRRLPHAAAAFVAQHRDALRRHLGDETDAVDERAAIIEFDGRAPRQWAEQFADILIRRRPAGVTDTDWSWFVTRCGQIIDEAPGGSR